MIELKTRVCNRKVKQTICGDYTLKQLSTGFYIMGALFQKLSEGVKDTHNGLVTAREDLKKFYGMETEDDFNALADFLMSHHFDYEEGRGKSKKYYGGSIIGGITTDSEGMEIRLTRGDELLEGLLKGDTISQAFQRMDDLIKSAGENESGGF